MPVSTVNFIKEAVRQKQNEDFNFLQRMLYFFELRFAPQAQFKGLGSFLFPLVLPPSSYSLEEPFSVQATPTQGGGLYVEENGIIQRTIRIKGNTGFKPRNLKFFGGTSPIPEITSDVERSFSRKLKRQVFGEISGQRHFQYLQDSVFRTYADLKRNPATSEGTVLIFHNPKDQESWQVVPQRFSLERDSGKPHIYNYNIDLLVVDKASSVEADFSEDKSVMDMLKDGLRMVKKGIDMITGAVNDLTALQGQIEGQIKNIAVILNSVGNILTAATDFTEGTTSLIQAPYASLSAVDRLIEEATALTVAQKELAGHTEKEGFPDKVIQKLRDIQDGVSMLGTNPGNWETPTEETIRKIREAQEQNQTISAERKKEALESEAPTTFDEVRNQGTKLSPGDAISMDGELLVGKGTTKYLSAKRVRVNYGDTLASLAAQYMGDARLWQQIAVINNLKPPYIDSQASAPLISTDGGGASGGATGADESPFRNTLGVGSYILIPSNLPATVDMPLLPVLGVQLEEPVENQFLGIDFKLEAVQGTASSSRAFYDIPVNESGGSTDAKLAEGFDNLSQGIISRLSTEHGTCILHKNVGVRRIVSFNFTLIDIENGKFRIQEAIEADPRIAEIRNIQFEQDQDNFLTTLDAVARGFTESKPLKAAI